jgi:hypothetical protein
MATWRAIITDPANLVRVDSINDGDEARIKDGLILKIRGCATRNLI